MKTDPPGHLFTIPRDGAPPDGSLLALPGPRPHEPAYSGTPIHVKISAARSSGSLNKAGTSESTNVMPDVLAPMAYAARWSRPSTKPPASCTSR